MTDDRLERLRWAVVRREPNIGMYGAYGGMVRCEDGDFVYYEDVEEKLAALERVLALRDAMYNAENEGVCGVMSIAPEEIDRALRGEGG